MQQHKQLCNSVLQPRVDPRIEDLVAALADDLTRGLLPLAGAEGPYHPLPSSAVLDLPSYHPFP